MTGIICALGYEAELLISKLENKSTECVSGITFTSGTLHSKNVVIAVCGVGKVFAAICAQTMILRYSPSLIINTGVAGAVHSSLVCGDITVASSVVQHDMDTSPLGDPKGLISGINIINFKCAPQKDVIAQIAEQNGCKSLIGVIASGDQFVASAEKKDFIENNFSAVACDMEAGAIGHACYINSTPFCVIRAISDSADGSAHLDYPTFSKMAANNAANIIDQFLAN